MNEKKCPAITEGSGAGITELNNNVTRYNKDVKYDEDVQKLEEGQNFQFSREIMRFGNQSEYVWLFENYLYRMERALYKTPVNSFHPTEDGQAEAAEYYMDGMIRYTDGSGWLAYDYVNGYFRPDLGEALLRFCLQKLARERYDLRLANEPKEFAKFAEKAVTEPCIRHVEKLLESRRSVFALPKDFDAEPYLLNCKGETYDLRMGEHAPSLPEHFHAKTTGVRPEPGDFPVFLGFLKDITCGDFELADWIMRWFGYCLTGDTKASYFVNFHGSGRNGKGTLLHVMRHIMGSYAREIDEEVIVDTGRRGNVKNALVNLVGIRAGFAADVPAGSLNLTDLKKITGGDEMVAERKYHDSFAFRPIVKLTFSSNPKLRLPETGQAVKSRLRYVPFKAKFAGREDRGLEDRILKEAPQILAWLIREAGEYLKNADTCGFPPCRIIDEATEDYIREENIIGQFLEECTEKAPMGSVQAADLYKKYKDWSEKQGNRNPMSSNSFGRKMAENDIEKQRSAIGNVYRNIIIREEYV